MANLLRSRWLAVCAALLVSVLTLSTVLSQTESTPEPTPPVTLELLRPEVISTHPHDTSSYTEGLVWNNGRMYESAGSYGESDVREVDPQTGEILQIVELKPEIFGEGLALVDNDLVQLSWKEGYAFVYDSDTLTWKTTLQYFGEGWGLCYDGSQLWMSTGSDKLDMRDPATFNQLGQVSVTLLGLAVEEINELECVGDSIYANVFLTDRILRIDKATGQVTGVIDASGLLTPEERANLGSGEVLNGIAYDPVNDSFWITGKHWPNIYEVRFVPVESLQPIAP